MTYAPQAVGVAAPAGGFKQGGWYGGRQYYNGTLSDVNSIHPESSQQGAGQQVSAAVNAQSAAQQGVSVPQFNNYLQQQSSKQQTPAPNTNAGNPAGGGDGSQAGTGDASGAGGVGMAQPATIDLQGMYQNLYSSSGVTDLEQQITGKTKQFNQDQANINDNPYLSEASRTGRLAKLQMAFDNDIKNDHDSLAQKRADIDTQIQLQTKQFDINSQVAKQGMDQFNSLLQSGALDNASGADIASITRATGMSSNMVQSAVAASKAKNQKEQKTQVISFDDGTSQGFAIIDPQTGDIINKQIVAGSKILGTAQDKAAYKSTGNGKVKAADNKSEALQQLPVDFEKNKMTLGTAMKFYQQFNLSPQDIYNQYKVSGQYNPNEKATKADKKRYNVK